jgi:hypothetical protein
MESSQKSLRAILPLGKYRVVEKGTTHIKVAMGGSTTMTINLPNMHLYDIREGDLLTYYTEVLFAKPQG